MSGGVKIVPRHFAEGGIIFEEGEFGTTAYVIQDGLVEISMTREGNTRVIATIGAGACFGEMAALAGGARSATARAKKTTEVFEIDAYGLRELLQQSQPVARAVVQSLIERIRHVNEESLASSARQEPIVSIAHLLVLLALPRQGIEEKGAKKENGEELFDIVPLARVSATAAEVLGMYVFRCKEVLKHMAELNLVSLQTKDGRQLVKFRSKEIVAAATNLCRSMGEALNAKLEDSFELIDLAGLSEAVAVDRDKLLKKFGAGELPEDLFLFRKSAALALLQTQGKAFFERRKLKRVEDLEGLDDLEFVDRTTLGAALSQLEAYSVALLMKTAAEEPKKRIIGALSQRMRQVVETTASSVQDVDPVEVQQLEQDLISSIKRIKLEKTG